MKTLQIKFDSSFIEEAVFILVQSLEKRGDKALGESFHGEKNRIYKMTSTNERDAAFRQFHVQYFSKLGLSGLMDRMIAEFPHFLKFQPLFFVKRVWSSKQEGVELYHESDVWTVHINLLVIRVRDLVNLEKYLRHELFHISDMLDPQFCYSPSPVFPEYSSGGSPISTEIEKDLIRSRFRFLWNYYISSRIALKGLHSHLAFESLDKTFRKAFPYWDENQRKKISQEMRDGRIFKQGDLLDLAAEPIQYQQGGSGAFRCPLCSFPSFDKMDVLGAQEKIIIEEIQLDRPDWNPALGLCRQCFDLYESSLVLDGRRLDSQ